MRDIQFSTQTDLQEFLIEAFTLPGEHAGARRFNLAVLLDLAANRTSEVIPMTRGGALAYVLKHFPSLRLTPRGRALAEKLGLVKDLFEVEDGKADPPKPVGTWAKRLGVKGMRWEDLDIVVADKGTVVTFQPTGKLILETWDIGFLNRREGQLLKDLQLTATLEAKKNTISILRTALKKAAGISENPFTCEDGLYTRRFTMGDQGGGGGGESEERFNDGYQIRTARRR